MKNYRLLCLTVTLVCISCQLFAQESSGSLKDVWKQHFRQEMSELDSLSNLPNYGITEEGEEEEIGKQIQQKIELRKLFAPYGDIGSAFIADSIRALSLDATGRHNGCAKRNMEPIGSIGDPEAAYNTPGNFLYHGNKNGRMDCIAFKAGDPNILYVGTGSGNNQRMGVRHLQPTIITGEDTIPTISR